MAKGIDKNRLRSGVSALFDQTAGGAAGLEHPRRGGRPEKGRAGRFSRKTQKVTSVVFDPDQHEYLKELSLKTGVTFKEVMFLLIREGIVRYERGEVDIKSGIR